MASADDELEVGAIVAGRYELVRLLGVGGFGAVWETRDVLDDRRLALKVITARPTAETRRRAMREADILQTIHHPHLVHAYGVFEDEGRLAIVMDLVEGVTLSRVLRSCAEQRTVPSLRVVGDVLRAICSGVGAAHDRGIVHRDLKPANVMIERGGDRRVKVLDFGVARDLATSAHEATTVGRRIGSYLYMSPEQARGEAPDGRSDVFSIGAIAFELLTLRYAFAVSPDGPLFRAFPISSDERNGMARVLARIASDARPVPSDYRANLPPAVDEVVLRALAVRADDRPATVGAFYAELEEALALAHDPTATVVFEDSSLPASTFDDLGALRLPVDQPAVVTATPDAHAAREAQADRDDARARVVDARDGTVADDRSEASPVLDSNVAVAPKRRLAATAALVSVAATALVVVVASLDGAPSEVPLEPAASAPTPRALPGATAVGEAPADADPARAASDYGADPTTADPIPAAPSASDDAAPSRRADPIPAAPSASDDAAAPAPSRRADPIPAAPASDGPDPAAASGSPQPARRTIRSAEPPAPRSPGQDAGLAKLEAALTRLERSPSAAGASRLSQQIVAEAKRVTDPRVRARIERRAFSSGVVGDVIGLRESFTLLAESVGKRRAEPPNR